MKRWRPRLDQDAWADTEGEYHRITGKDIADRYGIAGFDEHLQNRLTECAKAKGLRWRKWIF